MSHEPPDPFEESRKQLLVERDDLIAALRIDLEQAAKVAEQLRADLAIAEHARDTYDLDTQRLRKIEVELRTLLVTRVEAARLTEANRELAATECLLTATQAEWHADVERAMERIKELEATLTTISGIRDSLVGFQQFNWSEHACPLVAALDAAGFVGVGHKIAAPNCNTLVNAKLKSDFERDAAKAAHGQAIEAGLILQEQRDAAVSERDAAEAVQQTQEDRCRELISEADARAAAAVSEAKALTEKLELRGKAIRALCETADFPERFMARTAPGAAQRNLRLVIDEAKTTWPELFRNDEENANAK